MTWMDGFQIALYFVVLVLLVKPLGTYMMCVYTGERTWGRSILLPVERFIYRLVGVQPEQEMDWKTYVAAVLVFNGLGFMFLYFLLRLQAYLPLNPQGFANLNPWLAFNVAVSFVTNTNWQSYSGETTLSYLSQMLGLGVQNFLSAATGMAVLMAFIRGIARNKTNKLGNFFVDATRSTLYILVPLSIVLALLLISQGVVQTMGSYQSINLLQASESGEAQILALGPAASQLAIKQIGTNGGGFFNVNSAHPFENATPFSNFLETLAILLIPAALTYTFGRMVADTRQGWALLVVMLLIFTTLLAFGLWAEQHPNPALIGMGIDQSAGNMEGKEARFGVANSVLWAAATTAASNGSVNSMHASFTPLGSLVPLWLMQLGEIIFGGVGSGLYGMLAFVIVAVFVAGLMIGRTPEYVGKKIEAFEMKMASLILLIPIFVILVGVGIAVSYPAGQASVLNPGPHGFTEILYAFSSAGNNNGSAFAGLNANTDFYNIILGIVMLIARYWLIIPTMAIAGSLAGKKKIPVTVGTMPTHSLLFMAWLIAVILIVGALSFFPVLALGPIVEGLM